MEEADDDFAMMDGGLRTLIELIRTRLEAAEDAANLEALIFERRRGATSDYELDFLNTLLMVVALASAELPVD